MERGEVRTDAWSARMRDKYGLDTSRFTYNPERGQAGGATESIEGRAPSAAQRRRCAIM